MCGIVGIVGKNRVNQALYDGLTVLQHRGQDAAGIVTSDGSRLYMRKSNGLVRDVFHTRHMTRMQGNMGIAHVRYPTAGSSSSAEAQPFYVNSPFGICLAHNGNLTNVAQLKQDLFNTDRRHINTNSDSEVLLNVFAHELQKQNSFDISAKEIFSTISELHRRCKGGYAVIAMITGVGIVGFRDPNGLRPIVFGRRESTQGTEFVIASESVAIQSLGFELIRDIAPGEAVFINEAGDLSTQQCAEKTELSPCIFEHVYFARPDSIIDNISVYKARLRMGESLADKILREMPNHDIDVVIPIPDTSRTSALPLANKLGVPYREGFVKNRYIGRTFIMPGQKQRKKSVRQKLNAIDLEFKGKKVLLVDDSIVRGTTSMQIIQMAREAGASKVYFASAAPPVRFPNVYGIDMPTTDELLGHNKSEQQIAEEIGADSLIFQDLDDLVRAAQKGNPSIKRFDTSVFSGEYITGDVSEEYLASIAKRRNNGPYLEQLESDESGIEIHNSN
ncbi:MAG: amidophosphoribosyltransferase [Thiohalomonadales bacterium]